MTLTAKQQAVLRAKKAMKAGHPNFKPRGRKNKKIFKQVLEGIDPNEEREPSPHRQLSELQASQDKEDDGDDLYIMRYSNDRTILKIGRSKNVEARRRQLQSGHNFFVETKAIFPKCGYLERTIHHQIRDRRCKSGPGREWFAISLEDAMCVISKAMTAKEQEMTEPAANAQGCSITLAVDQKWKWTFRSVFASPLAETIRG